MGSNLTQWFSIRSDSAPQRTSGGIWRHFCLLQCQEEDGTVIFWTEMLLNSLQGIEQPPTQGITQPQIAIVPRLKTPL